MEPSRRRAYDVEPAVEVYVQDALRETRHELRNDILALSTKVDLAQQISSGEHAEVKAKLDQLQRDVVALQPLAADVSALKTADAVDHASALATEKLLTRQRTQFYALAGLIVAAAGVISAFGH